MSRALGGALAALVLLLALLPPADPPDLASDVPGSPELHPAVAAMDLCLPGLFAPSGPDGSRFDVRGTWADALGLPGPPDSLLVPTHVGMTALLLAMVALAFARGPLAWAARGAALAGLLLLLLGTVPGAWSVGRLLLMAGLALLAGLQLRDLGLDPEPRPDGQAGMALGGLSVVVTAALALVALQVGSQSDHVVAHPAMARFMDLVPDGFAGVQLREVIAANALRLALDRAALASFAAMAALLLHLRSRNRVTGLLVLGVAAAELLVPRLLG